MKCEKTINSLLLSALAASFGCHCVGYDSGDAVSQDYKTPGTFKGGEIFFVGVTVEKTDYLGLEEEAQRAFMRD
jgi:hypothetical protein